MIKTWEDDELGRKEDAQFLKEFLEQRFEVSKGISGSGSFVLNINAEWGLGKTYFLRNLKEDLRKDGFLAVYFNAWETDFASDPLIAFISEIESQLSPLLRKSSKAQGYLRDTVASANKLLKPSLPILLSILAKKLTGFSLEQLKNLVDEGGSIPDFEENSRDFQGNKKLAEEFVSTLVSKSAETALLEHISSKKSISTFKENLRIFLDYVENKLQSKKLPLFIFVDELDRCRPTYAIEILEEIKHLFGVDGVYFIIATDSRQLSHSIKAVYGESFDSVRYLKRFFDLEYSFSLPDYENFSKHLFQKYRLHNEAMFFSPIDAGLLSNKKSDLCQIFFSKCSDFFRLSLRDQEQISSMLNIVRLTYQGSTIHIAYFLFLAILRHRFPEEFDTFLLGDIASKRRFARPFFEDRLNAFNRIASIEAIVFESNLDREAGSVRIEDIFMQYIEISGETSEKFRSGNQKNSVYHGISLKISLDSKNYAKTALGHDLNEYPIIVQRIGRLTVHSSQA